MIGESRVVKDECLDEEKAAKVALRLPIAFAEDRLLTDNRSDFSLGGHRLSSLYRKTRIDAADLTNRYFSAFSSLKYSNSTQAGVTAPGAAT